MSELTFRVILVCQERTDDVRRQRLLSCVKNIIVNCDLTNVAIDFSQVKKSEDDDYPEIEGLIFDVRAKCKTNYHGYPKVQSYANFLSSWKRQCSSLPCSYIEFFANDSFVKCKNSHHVIEYQSLAFGVLPHDGQYHQFETLKPDADQRVHFYHDTRNVMIPYKTFQVNFAYENIRNIFVAIDSYPYDVFFDLFNPPIIYRIHKRNDMRYRNLNFSEVVAVHNLFRGLGISRNYLFSYSPGEIEVDVLGRSNVLRLSFNDAKVMKEIVSRIHSHCSEKSVYYSNITSVQKISPRDPVIGSDMHFDCTYLITAMIKRNFVLLSQTPDIASSLRGLHRLSQQNAGALEKALTSVLAALDSGKILNFWQAIDDQYTYYSTHKDEIHFKDYIVPSKCRMIRRITLTPTRQLLWPKEIMFGNRVLRKFDSEYAVRVSFREDNMYRLSGNAPYADPGFCESCVKNPMTSGLKIGTRRYDFLAWSNSQIRDHGVWMYARDQEGNTAENVRQWMGDFSHIKNVPKYMARMGQCFSQTEDALSVPLDNKYIRTEKDIERGWDIHNNKPYCFSDGIGKISVGLAAKVHKALGHDKLCSAFQVRYGGYKGMLVIDPTLKDVDIVFRESMKKFDCPNSTRLEIAQTSAPIPLQLNRPFIAILNSLGVRHRVFLRLQEDMLKTLTDMLYDETEAIKFLQSKTPTNWYSFEDLSVSGIHLTTEPYFKSLLLALHRHHIKNIKLRANIAVDPSKGRNMMGVLDETNTLRYGQVFVQYSRDISYGETTKDTLIRTGEVLVTKNPCMYPGDVRKFQAIDVPALRHIVDCIVFPQSGPRPHPNEMAGSDLDGDQYTVLWDDPELIFKSRNKTAADFPAKHSENVVDVDVNHMIEFLQDYIKGDQVGVIANAHLAQAHNIEDAKNLEENRQGIFSDVCDMIAYKFSIAVDFAKNGCPQKLDKTERPTMYPDFMEKGDREAFKSDMALGKMYRVCKDFESENEITSVCYENVEVDPDLRYDGWENYKDNAIAARNKYNALFRSVLRNYGIQHEAEALSGAFTHLHCRFQERKDRAEIEKVIIGCIKKLNSSMLEEFMEEFEIPDGDVATMDRKMLQKASAWYVVTYSERDAKFLSFPWTVSKYLVNIKLRKTLGNPLPFSPAIMNLDKKILEFESLPDYVETNIWNNYDILCDPKLLRRALRTLMLWAQEEEVVERPGHYQGLLYVDVFIRLFLHVAALLKYVRPVFPTPVTTEVKDHYSAAHLCLEFLKFCSTLRFYNKYDIVDVLPFTVYKYNQLAKRAIISYHTFALSGTLHTLNRDKKLEQDVIQMKPFPIESKIFLSSPIKAESLKKAENALIKYSGVNELSLREIHQTKKVQVSAEGSEKAIKELKSILRKKHVVLRQLFNTGIMPQTN